VNNTPWCNILTDSKYSRTVRIFIRDNRGKYAERYVVTINEGLWRSQGDFTEFMPLVEYYGLTIAVLVKFTVQQKIDLTQGMGHNKLDMECFGREVRQILLLPTEDCMHESAFRQPNKLILAGYTIACHYEKERIGQVIRQPAEVYADGQIKFSNLIPVML